MIWSFDTPFHNPPETSEMTIRGRWAGHWIDLVTVGEDAFDGLGELAGWEDVTDELVDYAFAAISSDNWHDPITLSL